MIPSNWTLNAYTANAWTDLVPAASTPVILKSLSIAVGSNAVGVSIRLANSSGSRAMLVTSSLAANTSYSMDIPALTLAAGDKLQVQVTASGVEFAAFGAQ